MAEIDRVKLQTLSLDWLEHERWIQNGCPDAGSHEIRVPGYSLVIKQGVEAYDWYRHSFVPYFAVARGFSGLHEDLTRLVATTKAKYSEAARQLLADYLGPDDNFRSGWGTFLIQPFMRDLNNRSLTFYQRRFEIELPLRFLANMRELSSSGNFDPHLSRFRDRAGSLKKGSAAEYIKDGFKEYPVLSSVANLAFHQHLRNAVAHNAYTISQGGLRSLDGHLSMTKDAFVQHLEALQTLQNAVIWLFMSRFEEDRSALSSNGVLSIAWGQSADTKKPCLSIFQLAPFYSLDVRLEWLDKIVLHRKGDRLITLLGRGPTIEGPIPSEAGRTS